MTRHIAIDIGLARNHAAVVHLPRHGVGRSRSAELRFVGRVAGHHVQRRTPACEEESVLYRGGSRRRGAFVRRCLAVFVRLFRQFAAVPVEPGDGVAPHGSFKRRGVLCIFGDGSYCRIPGQERIGVLRRRVFGRIRMSRRLAVQISRVIDHGAVIHLPCHGVAALGLCEGRHVGHIACHGSYGRTPALERVTELGRGGTLGCRTAERRYHAVFAGLVRDLRTVPVDPGHGVAALRG